nr:MAG TPA: hypothetical protein [Caudoviricetes sp.]
MFNLARNTSLLHYKLYLGQNEIVDEYGNKTGSFTKQYGDLQSAFLCVSPNKGDASLEPFGTLLDYDRTMITADTTCPIAEDTILWLDGVNTTGPYNYYVKKRAPWKNSIVFAVKEVDVDG